VAVTTRPLRPTGVGTLYRSTIGKKMVMAVTGLVMLAFVVVHMLGNLKIFFGATEFNEYAHWLRTIGDPLLHEAWYLWVQRVGLTVALVAHVWAAISISRQDVRARPVGYRGRGRNPMTTYMRWGGVVLFLFIVYHLLDLTAGILNPAPEGAGVYGRVVYDFNEWYVVVGYTLAMIALGFHIGHGLWSAANTLGFRPATTRAVQTASGAVALVITIGFLVVPFAVVFGIVNIDSVR
jgi:succinate dehydrogenase / fumarate reductase cytochrome b subunit